MRTFVFVLAAVMIVMPSKATAQPVSSLSLDDCIRLAQNAPSAVRLARQQAEIARAAVTQARAGFLPQVRFSNTFTYNSPQLDNPGSPSFISLNGAREYSSQVAAALELDTSGRLRAAFARARADEDAATANLAVAQRDLRRAVTIAYLRLVLTRRLVAVAQDVLAEAESLEKRSTLLFQDGEAAQADVFKASAQAAFFRQALSVSHLDADLANHDLASFWTIAVSDPLAVVDVFDQPLPVPESPALATAPVQGLGPFARRPELVALDAERQGFLADARSARAELFPQTSFAVAYGLDSLQVRARDRGYASFVNLNIPVFDWFRARSAARQFELRAQQVDATHSIAERLFSKEYQDAVARVTQIYRQIAITQTQVTLSEQGLSLSRIRYEGGEGSILDVITAQNQLAQARTNRYTTMANYLTARTDLEVATSR